MTDREQTQALIVDLGRGLHRYGASTARVEDAMTQLAARLGIDGQFFVQPTALFASFGRAGAETYLLRLQPAVTDLTKLARLDTLLSALVHGDIDPQRGTSRLQEILEAKPGQWRRVVMLVGHGFAAAAAARFVGGGWPEVGAALAIGPLVGLLAWRAECRDAMRRIQVPLSAIVASFVAVAMASTLGTLNPQIAMLAGLVLLLPGMMLTVATNELATGHLASGTARAAGATMVFITMAFGVALGGRLAVMIFGPPAMLEPEPASIWSLVLALLIAPLAMAALFRAPSREIPFVVVGCVLAFCGGQLGARWLGAELGVFVGGLLAGLAANGYARWRNKPSAIVYVPAMLMLVPGSIGFRSITALLAEQVTSGIDAAFTTLLMTVALGTGMLVAGVVIPPRRVL
ncbi:MAG: threonine/serine exporter family protein [Acidobacteriota bacterium]